MNKMAKQKTDNNSTNNTKYKAQYERDPNVDYGYIKKYIAHYFVSEPFYGRILSRILLVEDWNVPTAYVTFDMDSYKQTGNLAYKVGYNPAFIHEELAAKYKDANGKLDLNNISDTVGKEIGFVVTHELLHLLLSHLTDRNIFTTNKNERQLVNIAMDLAINSLLEDPANKGSKFKVPDICFLPGKASKTQDQELNELIKSMPTLQNTMFYYRLLKDYLDKKQQEQDENGEGEGDSCDVVLGDGEGDGSYGFDSHDGWEDLPKEVREQIKAHIKGQVQEAINAAQRTNNWGSASSSTQELMKKIAAPNLVNWKDLLQIAIGQCKLQENESTYRKVSKKLPYLMPGEKRKYSAPIAFFIDQSGSMANTDVQLAFSQAVYCASNIQIDVFNFDTEVDQKSHQVWKRNNGNQTWQRTRDGGTDFNAIKRYLESPTAKHKKNWKWIVIVTDGYAPVMDPILPRVLWLITPSGEEPKNVRAGDLVVKMKLPNQAEELPI